MNPCNFSKMAVGLMLGLTALVGCGGGGQKTNADSFETQGSVNSSVEISVAPIPASTSSQIVSIGGVEALLPPIGAKVPAGAHLALFGVHTNPLGPIEADDGNLTRGPIDAIIWKEGQPSMLISGLVTREGLSQPVVLTPGTWHIEMKPCYVYKIADPSNRMTMQKIRFNFVVDSEGHHSLPRVVGKWPRNGSMLTSANFAIAVVDKAFADKSGKLTITGGGMTLTKSAEFTTYNATEVGAEFRDLAKPSKFIVPSPHGLNLVTFDSAL